MSKLVFRRAGDTSLLTRDSASVEYVLVVMVVVAALFMPSDLAGGQSVVGYLLDALRAFQAHTSVLLSLP